MQWFVSFARKVVNFLIITQKIELVHVILNNDWIECEE